MFRPPTRGMVAWQNNSVGSGMAVVVVDLYIFVVNVLYKLDNDNRPMPKASRRDNQNSYGASSSGSDGSVAKWRDNFALAFVWEMKENKMADVLAKFVMCRK